MESKIQRTLLQWFPAAFARAEKSEIDNDYKILQYFATFTQKLIDEKNENRREPFKVINLIYLNTSLHDKNAIENEFFGLLAKNDSPASLKEHLDLMPASLRPVYIKTLIEN